MMICFSDTFRVNILSILDRRSMYVGKSRLNDLPSPTQAAMQ